MALRLARSAQGETRGCSRGRLRRPRGERTGGRTCSPRACAPARLRVCASARLRTCAPARLRVCASAQLARSRQGRTCRRPAASRGSRAWSLVPGPWSWRPRGREQALPRTLSLGQTHRFPAPTISSARRVGTARNQRGHGSPKPLWHGSPAKLFVAEWVTEGARGARALRSVPALWGCGFPVSLLRGVKQARSGELPVSPSAEDAREQSADTRDWAGANAKETA